MECCVLVQAPLRSRLLPYARVELRKSLADRLKTAMLRTWSIAEIMWFQLQYKWGANWVRRLDLSSREDAARTGSLDRGEQ